MFIWLLPLLAFSIVVVVDADECQDYCVQELGAATCSRGTYCKRGTDCHALFFMSANRTSICVFDGSEGCLDSIPVTCAEARNRLGTTSTTEAPAVVSTTRTPIQLNRRRTGGIGSLEFPLHHRNSEQRPRVFIELENNLPERMLSLVVDTRASFTVIGEHEELGAVGGVRSRLDRAEVARRGLNITGELSESARLVSGGSSLSFGLSVFVTGQQEGVDAGTLGASPTSDFAMRVGMFALVGTDRLVIQRGSLEALEAYCEAESGQRITMFESESMTQWTVAGSVAVNGESAVAAQWIVASGEDGIVVPRLVFERVAAEIEATGGLIDAARLLSLPTLVVSIGSEAVTVTISPTDYMRENGGVYESLLREGSDAEPLLLSPQILSRLVTLLDVRQMRIGFCRI